MLKYIAAEFQYEACAEFVSRRRQCCECRPHLFFPAVPQLDTFVQATAIESYCTGVLTWVFAWILTSAYTVLTRVLTGTYTSAVRCPALASSISSGDLFFLFARAPCPCVLTFRKGNLESQRMLVTFTGPWPPDLTVFQNSHIFILPPRALGGTKLTHSTGYHLPRFP